MTWAYLASLVVTGLFAWWYKDFAKDTLGGWRLFRLLKNEKWEALELRKSIVTRINFLIE